MKQFNLVIISLFFLSIVGLSPTVFAKTKTHVDIITAPDNDFYVSDAAYFKGESGKEKQAIIFVPGFIFNKESWFSLAKKMQQKGVSSLSINAKNVAAVKASILYLKDKGYQKISLVGGSSGAAAVLMAMKDVEPLVTKVITLSAVRGNALQSTKVDKLFIVSKGEKSLSKVSSFYAESSEPKQLKVFPGKKHAQFLLKSQHKDELTKLMVEFLLK